MGLLDAPGVTPRKFELLRRRDLPGLAAVPSKVMASPPTIGAPTTTTSLTGGALIPPDDGRFRILGAKTTRGGAFPDTNGIAASTMYGITTGSPYMVDFTLDTADATGRFEVLYKRVSAVAARLLVQVDGVWQYVTNAETFSGTANDLAYSLVTMGAPGIYRLRLECNTGFRFAGVQVPTLSDGILAAPPARRRIVIVGDSYTEPTINETGPYISGGDGYGTLLSYALGAEVWLAGAGGTGYLQTFTGPPARGNLLTRISEITPFVSGAEVWLTMGINDYGNFTAAQIGAAATTCISTFLSAGATRVVVWGPFWPRSIFNIANNVLATRDAIKAAAVAAGQPFCDLLNLSVPQQQAAPTVLANATLAQANTIQTPVALGTGDYHVQIGTGPTAEVRRVGAQSGTGPFTYGFGNADRGGNLANAHAAGEPVIPCGPAFITGNGKQGTPTGLGTADRYTGADATHPTKAGHRNIMRTMLAVYAEQLAP